MILLGVLLVLAVGVAVAVPLALRTRPLTPFDQGRALQSATIKLDGIQAQLKQGQAQVTLSQAEVRAILSQELGRGASLPVRGVDVTLAPGRLDVQAMVSLSGKAVSVALGGEPRVVGGNLVLTVDQVKLGSLPVPVESALRLLAPVGGLAVDANAKTVAFPLADMRLDGQPVRLNDLSLGSGQLTVDLSSQ